MEELRLSLWHDGTHWIASNKDITFRGGSLEELDQRVRSYVLSSGTTTKGEAVRVYMYYDDRTIPQWIRQYAQHYFDRVLEIKT